MKEKAPWGIKKFNILTTKVKLTTRQSESHSVVSDSLQSHALYSPWNSPDQNTGGIIFPFSKGFPQPRDQTQVSCIAGQFFTSWATREAQEY